MMMINLNKAVSLAVVASLALILILGSLSTSYSQVFAKGDGSGNNNDNNQNSNPGDSNNRGNDQQQQPPKDQQPTAGTGVGVNPSLPSPPPSSVEPLLPVKSEKIDCSKTPDDPSCKPRDVKPPVDCTVTPDDPSCPPVTTKGDKCPDVFPRPPGCDPVTPKPVKGPDDDCQFHPELDKCKSDNGKCPPGFSNNGNDHCYKTGPCPPGFAREDNDESGACKKQKQPPPICTHQFPNPNCPPPPHPICKPPFKLIHGRCTEIINIIINIHKNTKHISSNSNPSSMVTKDTRLTPELTVGEAIDGCKDVNSKSANDLQKSCDIFMVSTLNYCLTHQSIAHKDSNICSDPLYLKNVPQYLDTNNVNLNLFPPTIYNIVP